MIDSLTRSISSSDEYDDDDVISLDSPIEQQPKTSDNVISPPNSPVVQHVRLSCNDGTTTVTVTYSPHHSRSDHISEISLMSNPYKAKPTEQHVLVNVNPALENCDHKNC